jgi:hypothetical protein
MWVDRLSRRIGFVRGVLRSPAVAIAALLLSVALTACGGGDSSGSTASQPAQGQPADGSSKKEKEGSGKADSGNGKSRSGESKQVAPKDEAEEASKFTPKQHDDSGGGSKPLRAKGGDNSVQDYGTEAGGSDFEDAAAALHNFLDARAQGNWAAACSFMSSSMVESLETLASRSKQVGSKGCAEILGTLTPQSEVTAPNGLLVKEAKIANVRSVRVEGDRAFIIYIGLEKNVMAMSMVKEDGEWKVGSLGGVPLN